jgi:hypothetical protein
LANPFGNTRAQRPLPCPYRIRRLPLSASEHHDSAVPKDVGLPVRASELIIEREHEPKLTL